jgi:hypothetical protein
MFNHLVVKKEEYTIFKEIVLQSLESKQRNKHTLIEMVKIYYKFQGKSKTRKRELTEIFEIIENKTVYFNKKLINKYKMILIEISDKF